MSTRSLVRNDPAGARLAGALLVGGVIVFTVGAFWPVPIDYTGPVAGQYADVENDPVMWLLSHVFYLVGIALTTGGLYVLATLFGAPRGRRLALAAVGVHALAFAAFAAGTYYRVTLPGSGATVPALFEAAMSGWLYATYLYLTLGAFAVLGAALVAGSTSRRLGWYAIGLSVAEIALFVALGDLPPLLFYLVTLPIGVRLLRQAGRALKAEPADDGTARPT